jgi:hypothetical protein
VIGAVSRRWLEQRARQHRVVQLQHQLDEALAARRAGRAERSGRTSKGWPTRIHETYQGDLLVKQRVSTTPIDTTATQEITRTPSRLIGSTAASSGELASFPCDMVTASPEPWPLLEKVNVSGRIGYFLDDTRPCIAPEAARFGGLRRAIGAAYRKMKAAAAAISPQLPNAKMHNSALAWSQPLTSPQTLMMIGPPAPDTGMNGQMLHDNEGRPASAALATKAYTAASRRPHAQIHETFQRDALINQGARAQ